jgi:hypothetical protein
MAQGPLRTNSPLRSNSAVEESVPYVVVGAVTLHVFAADEISRCCFWIDQPLNYVSA